MSYRFRFAATAWFDLTYLFSPYSKTFCTALAVKIVFS